MRRREHISHPVTEQLVQLDSKDTLLEEEATTNKWNEWNQRTTATRCKLWTGLRFDELRQTTDLNDATERRSPKSTNVPQELKSPRAPLQAHSQHSTNWGVRNCRLVPARECGCQCCIRKVLRPCKQRSLQGPTGTESGSSTNRHFLSLSLVEA